MKTIDTLVEDIYKVLEDGTEVTPHLRGSFQTMCTKILDRALTKYQGGSYIRMSNIGKKNRQLWYELKGYKGERISGNTLLKFLYGDIIEALVLTLAKAAGHNVSNEQYQVNVDGIRGSIDAVIDGELIDVKSCSTYAFNNKFKDVADLGDDEFGYAAQGAGYAAGMGMPFHGWLAIDKQNGSMRVAKATQEDMPDASVLIAEKRAVAEMEEPPERCYEDVPFQKSGNMQLATGCSYCRYKGKCWEDANDGAGLRKFLYAGKPVFLTKVVVEPRVQEML